MIIAICIIVYILIAFGVGCFLTYQLNLYRNGIETWLNSDFDNDLQSGFNAVLSIFWVITIPLYCIAYTSIKLVEKLTSVEKEVAIRAEIEKLRDNTVNGVKGAKLFSDKELRKMAKQNLRNS